VKTLHTAKLGEELSIPSKEKYHAIFEETK